MKWTNNDFQDPSAKKTKETTRFFIGKSTYIEKKLINGTGEILYLPLYLPKPTATQIFQHLRTQLNWQSLPITLFGKQIMQPRQICWIGDVPYTYSKLTLKPDPWPEWLLTLKTQLERDISDSLFKSSGPSGQEMNKEYFYIHDVAEYKDTTSPHTDSNISSRAGKSQIQFNGCLCNLYRDGQDYMGYHSDDEPELGPEPIIVSISLGSERRFLLKMKEYLGSFGTLSTKERTAAKKASVIEYTLAHGSCLIMKGKTQEYWRHSIPKTAKKVGERINLTFRVLSTN